MLPFFIVLLLFGTFFRQQSCGEYQHNSFSLCIKSKEVVENSWDMLNAILGHRYYQESPKPGHIKRIKPNGATEKEGFVVAYYFVSLTFDLNL